MHPQIQPIDINQPPSFDSAQIGKIRLPVSDYPVTLADMVASFHPTGTAMNLTLTDEEIYAAAAVTRLRSRQWMVFNSSFVVYMIALLSFVGWFLFAVSSKQQTKQNALRTARLIHLSHADTHFVPYHHRLMHPSHAHTTSYQLHYI